MRYFTAKAILLILLLCLLPSPVEALINPSQLSYDATLTALSNKLSINLANPNTWSAAQTFSARVKLVAATSSQITLAFGTSGTDYQDIWYNDVTGSLSLGNPGANTYPVILQPYGGRTLVGKTADDGVCRMQVAVTANTDTMQVGTPAGGFAVTALNGLYGLYAGVANGGHSWMQSGRNDGTATAYPLSLNASGGNVLIGTATDGLSGRVLQVSGSGTVVAHVKNTSTSGTYNYASLQADSDIVNASLVSWGTGSARAGTAWVGTTTNHPIVFGQYDNEAARISTGKNFLIGTATDDGTNKLQVNGGIKSNITFSNGSLQEDWGLKLVASQGGAWFSRSGLQFRWNDTGNNYAFNAAGVIGGATTWDGTVGTGHLGFYTKSSGIPSVDPTEKMRITGSGNVLVGTTTDDGANKLQVNGNVKASFIGAGGVTDTSYYWLTVASNVGKATTLVSNVASFGSSDATASADLSLIVRIGGNSTAGSRWTGLTSYESGAGARALILQDLGGSVVIGSAALATDATSGFLYIDTCAGTPTGTPTTFTGRAAVVFDTSANVLQIYNPVTASWRAAQF